MVKIVSVSRQKWIYVLFCFCWNARLANGKLWDGAGAEMSAGLRSRFHFPHYLRLCQVTGETLGGCQCGCVCVCCGGGVGAGGELGCAEASPVGFLEPVSPEARSQNICSLFTYRTVIHFLFLTELVYRLSIIYSLYLAL